MRALVRLRLPDGSLADLAPGDLVGRIGSAALVIDDPRVSEAHALVSLRGGELYLLSLRRMLACRGAPVSEVLLEPGLVVELAQGLALEVLAVEKPAKLVGLRSRAFGLRALGQVATVIAGPPLRLVGRFAPEGVAHLWSNGADAWRLRLGDARPRALAVGDRFTAAGESFEVCTIDLRAASRDPTLAGGGIAPLHVVAHYDSVEIHQPDRPALLIGGIGARIVSELVAFAGPVAWEVLAREVWRGEVDPGELRRRWDAALGRLRARLREAGVRGDLVSSDGAGQLQLVLYEGDRFDNRT
jgi:hypothetical protein